jgi:hypothetical protein|mmetsp:Transcript_26863/g.25721  ORF Transcript_26863/g.25721 Transcript_26863/m.25721 type:complete len:206 (+) Transcript_26863:121-738(+)
MYHRDGFGITGSKNVYINKTVRLGNWREDAIGSDLIELGRARSSPLNYNTSSQLIGSVPSSRPATTNGENIKFLSQEELKAKNKVGLPYALLFEHGKRGEDLAHNDIYTSQLRLASSKICLNMDCSNGNFPPVEDAHTKAKAKAVKKERDLSYKITTEARAMNGYVDKYRSETPNSAIGRSDVLPSARRSIGISSQVAPMVYRGK